MSGYATPAEETTPRTIYCAAPSDPTSMLQITGVMLLRNDENGIEIAITFDGRLQNVLHQLEAQAGNNHYMNLYSPVPQVVLVYGRRGVPDEKLIATIYLDTETKVWISNRGITDKQSAPSKIRGDQLIFSITPNMMQGLPAGKRAELHASFAEELWGPIPTSGGLNELIFKSEQVCSEGTQADSGASATAISPSASTPVARSGANTTQQSRVEQLDALLKSHSLSSDITMNSPNGRGQGTKFISNIGGNLALQGREEAARDCAVNRRVRM